MSLIIGAIMCLTVGAILYILQPLNFKFWKNIMTKQEFSQVFIDLALTQEEAAKLLSIHVRTIRRWAENPREISGPAQQAFLAWRRLEQLGIPWRPDGVDLVVDNPVELAKQITLYRNHAMQLDALLQKVQERGGPATPWQVDLKKRVATLGPLRVGFHSLLNGGFSPGYYRRTDCKPDLERDKALLEDAYACIASAIAGQQKQNKKSRDL